MLADTAAQNKDQKNAFDPYILDLPEGAPHLFLPPGMVGVLANFVQSATKPVDWKVGHVPPIGWFILNDQGGIAYVEHVEKMDVFWRLWQDDQLAKDPYIEKLQKRIEEIQKDVPQEHSDREEEKHLRELHLQYLAKGQKSPYADRFGTGPIDHPNQLKPSGLSTSNTSDPLNPNLEANKAASTSSFSSDSEGLPGNKTMQPNGVPPPRGKERDELNAAIDAAATGKPVAPATDSAPSVDSTKDTLVKLK